MVRQHQTRNLEIPGSMLRIAPERQRLFPARVGNDAARHQPVPDEQHHQRADGRGDKAGALIGAVMADRLPDRGREKSTDDAKHGGEDEAAGIVRARRKQPGEDARDNADNGGPELVFQLLWYPSTMWDASLPSFTENATAPILDVKGVAAFSRWYAADIDLSDPPPGMAPGRAKNLAGVAPAYIGVAGHDPLRDDGIRYGQLLAAAGVPVEVHNAVTMVHGYLGYAGVVPAATAGLERGLSALRNALHKQIGRVR